MVPIRREVVMKYLRYKFCGILCSVYVFFFQNKTINPLKKKCSLVSFKRDFHIEISNETGTRETVFVVVDRLKCDFIVI